MSDGAITYRFKPCDQCDYLVCNELFARFGPNLNIEMTTLPNGTPVKHSQACPVLAEKNEREAKKERLLKF